MSSVRNLSPGEANPFRPSVPESVRDISEDLFHFLQEQASALRETHGVTQAGDSTVPWEHLTWASNTEDFTLGSLGRFVHPEYGIITCRFVQFSDMAAVFPGSPVGIDKRVNSFQWLVTNQLELSDPSLVQGVCGAYDIPTKGQYGWVIVNGVNPQDMGFGGTPSQFLRLKWSATGEVGPGDTDSITIGRIFGRHFDPDGLAWSVPGGSIFIDVLSLQEATNAGIAQDTGNVEERLFILEQAFKGISYNVDVKLNESDIKLTQANDRVNQTAEMISRRVAAVDAAGIRAAIQDQLNLAATFANKAAVSADNAAIAQSQSFTNATSSNTTARSASISSDSAGFYADSATNSANAAQISSDNSDTQAAAAATSASNASVSETNAGTSATSAQNSATNAATSASSATTQAGNAGTSATNANNSAVAAAGSATAAGLSAGQATTSAGQAATSASNASTSATNAAGSASNAASSATTATSAATTATTQATNASNSATTAGNSATDAGVSAGNAATSASNAQTYSSNASTSASQASTSATNAGTSATNASNSASAANTSAVNAASSATAAAGSATTASNQAIAAATSASNASTSATNAGNSAAAAQTSATSASSYSTSAGTSATNASNAASAAGTSATTAGNSANAAGVSATNAANSAAAATTQASNASTSASQASTSASNAAGSAASASTSQTAAASSYTTTLAIAVNSLPPTFESPKYFTNIYNQPETAPDLDTGPFTFPTVTNVGVVVQHNNAAQTGDQSIINKGFLRVVANRVYRVTTKVRSTVDSVPAGNNMSYVAFYGYDATKTFINFAGDGVLAGNYGATKTSFHGNDTGTIADIPVSDGWQIMVWEYASGPVPVYNYLRGIVLINHSNGSGTMQVASLRIEDVTDQKNAESSANAAATSASNAATYSTAAGNSATSSQTFATNASTSATNASNSATTAGTQATNAGNSATNAANSATAAAGSAATAVTQASNASTSATNASNSATTAAGSAAGASTSQVAAANSATSASNLVRDQIPSTFESPVFFTGSDTQPETGLSLDSYGFTFPSVTGIGVVAQVTNTGLQSNSITHKGFMRVLPNRVYRVTMKIRSTVDSSSGADNRCYIAIMGYDSGKSEVGFVGDGLPVGNYGITKESYHGGDTGTIANVPVSDGWQTLGWEYSSGASPTVAFMRGFALMNYNTGNGTMQVAFLKLEDVTGPKSAENSAAAAATSASSAATQATNAGTSATAASNSAVTASTQATAASTSATNAGTNATNAANSAGTAGTNATNASNSATNASNSAAGAATSASNASVSATNAATSASNASGSAASASSSATTAATAYSNLTSLSTGLQAQINTNATAIASTQTQIATATFEVVTSAGTASSAIRLKASSDQNTGLEVSQIQFWDSVNGVRHLAAEINGGRSTWWGDMQVNGAVRIGANRIPIALQSFQIQAKDGDVVSFGADLTNIPTLLFDTSRLAVKTASQVYDVRAQSMTSTGFTLYAKITSASSPVTLTMTGATDAGAGVTPRYQMQKTNSSDANDGNYTFSVTLSVVFSGQTSWPDDPAQGYGEFEAYIRPSGGAWTLAGTIGKTATHNGNGTFNKSFSGVVNFGSTIGLDVSNAEFGIIVSAGVFVSFDSVAWIAMTTSGTSSASPSGELVTVTVIPQNF